MRNESINLYFCKRRACWCVNIGQDGLETAYHTRTRAIEWLTHIYGLSNV